MVPRNCCYTAFRWAIFSAWYYPPDKAFIVPQRKVLLGAEVSAAMGDEIVRFGMHEEGLDSDEHCDESDFLVSMVLVIVGYC